MLSFIIYFYTNFSFHGLGQVYTMGAERYGQSRLGPGPSAAARAGQGRGRALLLERARGPSAVARAVQCAERCGQSRLRSLSLGFFLGFFRPFVSIDLLSLRPFVIRSIVIRSFVFKAFCTHSIFETSLMDQVLYRLRQIKKQQSYVLSALLQLKFVFKYLDKMVPELLNSPI